MKILFITQFLPYPPDTGGKIKTYRILKLLARKHQIFLISFVDKEQDLKWEKDLRKLCYGLKTFITPIITASYRKLKLKVLLGIFYPKPFRLQKYFLKEVAGFIERLTKKEDFDAVHFDHATSLQYLPYVYEKERKLKIFDEHNLSYQGFLGYARYARNLPVRLIYLIEGIKFWLYEKRMIPFCDRILAINRLDRRKLIEWGINPKKVKYLPISFKVKPQFNFGSKNILFVGLMSWWPNKDAVLWFYQRIYPMIKKEIPEVRFWIVGANPDDQIKKMAEEDRSVVVTGYVENIADYFKKAGVFVVPVRTGAGVRIKILDAFSAGLPVVSTRMAVTGIEVNDKENILLADQEEEFAGAAVGVLRNKKLAQRLSREGLRFIQENYRQKQTQAVLDGALKKAKTKHK